MPMAKIDREKLKREIQLKIGKDNEVPLRTKRFALEVRDYWRHVAWPESAVKGRHGPIHPYDTGAYRDSIGISRLRSGLGRFVAGWKVSTDHHDANFIEYGTGIDKPGSRSPWGPNTPTPEFAPAAMTAHHFLGTAP